MCSGHVTRAIKRVSWLIQKSFDEACVTWQEVWPCGKGVEGCVAAVGARVRQPDTQAEDQSQQVHGTRIRHLGCHEVEQTLAGPAAVASALERRSAGWCTRPLQDMTEVQSPVISWTSLRMPLEEPWTRNTLRPHCQTVLSFLTAISSLSISFGKAVPNQVII